MKKLIPFFTVASSVALALLLTPANFRAAAAAGAIGLCLGAALYRYGAPLIGKADRNVPVILVSGVISAGICFKAMEAFYKAWRKVSRVRAVAAVFHLSGSAFTRLCAAALGAAAFPLVTLIVSVLARGITRPDCRHGKKLRVVLCLLITAALVFLQQYMLQLSAVNSFHPLRMMKTNMLAINIVALISFNALLCAVTGSVSTAFIVSTVLCFGWSLANYFVTLYHGSPLFFSEFANFKTAANVAGGYSFAIDRKVEVLLQQLIWQAVLVFVLSRNAAAKPADKKTRWKTGAWYAVLAAISGAVVLYCYNTPSIKPQTVMGWGWSPGVKEYGYITCIYEDIVKRIDPVVKPEGYSVQAVREIPLNGSEGRNGEHPDVILILNESFYDLSDYTDLPTDTDYLKSFYSLDGAHYGRACVPTLGGGTNNSEMELLMSNSMYLLPISAPFNYLDFTANKNALGAGFLAAGYSSAGMHTDRTNYSRHKVYPLIGFQQVLLGKDHYDHFERYGNRKWTDAGNYEDLKETYLSMGDGPRFIYMLTYQNHGDYDQNDASLAKVHSLRSFGELDHMVNEYLTSMSMSADAFVALTEYYRTVDRPVIICMMGDHAPTFITRLPAREGMTGQEQSVVARSVPYVVWSNYDMEWDGGDHVSLVDLGPLLKRAAGLPLSTYDQTILDLHEAAPIRTSAAMYITADGTFGQYDPQSDAPVDELFRRYLFMEYNLLKGGDDYRGELFAAGKAG